MYWSLLLLVILQPFLSIALLVENATLKGTRLSNDSSNKIDFYSTMNPSNTTTNSPFGLDEGFSGKHDHNARRVYETIYFAATGIYTPVIFVVGIVGNFIALIALNRGVLKSASSAYLVGLAIADFSFLAVSLPLPLNAYGYITQHQGWKTFFSYYISFGYPFGKLFYTTGVLITMSFTVERYIAICHPMKAKKYCTNFRARIIVVCVYLLGILINVSAFFLRVPVPVQNPDTNDTYYIYQLTILGRNGYYIAANFWLSFTATIMIPFLVMACLNTFVIRRLNTAREEHCNMSAVRDERRIENRKGRDNYITRILLGIVAVFFVCNICSAVSHIVLAVLGPRVAVIWEFRTFTVFSNTLIATNSFLNWVLYTTCSKRIRQAMLQVICPATVCGRRSNQPRE